MGGWLGNLRIRLTSASVEVEVELSGVEAELGNIEKSSLLPMQYCKVSFYHVEF